MDAHTVHEIIDAMFADIERRGVSMCVCGLIIGNDYQYCPWSQHKNAHFNIESYVDAHGTPPEENARITCAVESHTEEALWEAKRWDRIRSRFCRHCGKPYEQFLLVATKDETVVN